MKVVIIFIYCMQISPDVTLFPLCSLLLIHTSYWRLSVHY